jgi:hypothetical protein
MTKEQRRDKESSAKSHRQKNNGRRLRIEGLALSLFVSGGGMLNLAWRRTRGKVATKARSASASLPVVCRSRLDRIHELSEVRGCL